MISAIGMIIAAYAVTRLFQVPWEHSPTNTPARAQVKFGMLIASSLLGIAIVTYFALSLWMAPSQQQERQQDAIKERFSR